MEVMRGLKGLNNDADAGGSQGRGCIDFQLSAWLMMISWLVNDERWFNDVCWMIHDE